MTRYLMFTYSQGPNTWINVGAQEADTIDLALEQQFGDEAGTYAVVAERNWTSRRVRHQRTRIIEPIDITGADVLPGAPTEEVPPVEPTP